MLKLTWINVRGTNCNNIFSDANIFVDFVGVAHRIENRRIIVQIQHITINGDGRW